MSAATYRTSSYAAQTSVQRRSASFTLALAIGVLLVLALLRLGAFSPLKPDKDRPLTTFDLASEHPSPTRSQPQKKAARPATRTPEKTPPPQAPQPTPPVQVPFPDIIRLSSAEFAASDIGKIRRAPDAGATGGKGDADAGDSVAAAGTGPAGQKLYNAEWYREPSHAELVTYMPQGVRQGWGMIACRTIDRYHVEDCQEMGESPGSGLARALRQASWQFLVRPPRIGGKPLVGAWVRIRFDLIEGVQK